MEGASVIIIRLFDQQPTDEDVMETMIFKREEVSQEVAREIYEGHKLEALTFMIERDLP